MASEKAVACATTKIVEAYDQIAYVGILRTMPASGARNRYRLPGVRGPPTSSNSVGVAKRDHNAVAWAPCAIEDMCFGTPAARPTL
jgi:hypothetical protein